MKVALVVVLMLMGCATSNWQSACADCGLGANDRAARAVDEQTAWVRYFAGAMVNQELNTSVDYFDKEVIIDFRFHNNSDYPIDSVTLQLGNEVWEDNLGTSYPDNEYLREQGCKATSNCSAAIQIPKAKFCDKMNGLVWLTHIQNKPLEKPIWLMPTKATFCGVQ